MWLLFFRWRMNMLMTSQYQPRLSSITKIFPRRISQSDYSIQIKLHYYTITCLIVFQRDGKKGYDHELRPNNIIIMRLSGPYSYCWLRHDNMKFLSSILIVLIQHMRDITPFTSKHKFPLLNFKWHAIQYWRTSSYLCSIRFVHFIDLTVVFIS